MRIHVVMTSDPLAESMTFEVAARTRRRAERYLRERGYRPITEDDDDWADDWLDKEAWVREWGSGVRPGALHRRIAIIGRAALL